MSKNRITNEEREALKALDDLFDEGINYIDELEAKYKNMKEQNENYAKFVNSVNAAAMAYRNNGGE